MLNHFSVSYDHDIVCVSLSIVDFYLISCSVPFFVVLLLIGSPFIRLDCSHVCLMLVAFVYLNPCVLCVLCQIFSSYLAACWLLFLRIYSALFLVIDCVFLR